MSDVINRGIPLRYEDRGRALQAADELLEAIAAVFDDVTGDAVWYWVGAITGAARRAAENHDYSEQAAVLKKMLADGVPR